MAACICKIYKFLILISLCTLPYFVLASPVFEKQLKLADSVRTENPTQFNQLLIELENNLNNASTEQQEQFRYLQAYQVAYSGQHNLAIQKANAIFERSKNIAVKYRSGLLAVNSYAITRDFSAGFATLDKTLLLQDKIKDPQLRIHGLTVAAIFYNQAGQYSLGKEYAERILNSNPIPRSRCFANNLLLEALYNLESMPTSETQIEDMITSCSEIGELLLANGARANLVRSFNRRSEFRKSITLLEQHLSEVEATHYPPLVSDFHSLLADHKLRTDNLTEADIHAKIAVKESNAVPFSLPLVIAEKTLYEIAVRRNDKVAALEHYKKYAEADKAYLTDVKARELAYQLAKHETQQKTQTIALLNQKNEVLQLEQKVTKQAAQNTNLFVALLGVLLASIIFWAYRTKRTQMAFRVLAETDALTGISNRDHFTKRAEQALLDSIKKKEALALVMFDLDNFKSINDRYGHATGDWVLKKVIEVCAPICRKSDAIGRLGGEEFAILLSPCDKDNALRIAERCRESIAAINTDETGHPFTITASFGVNTTIAAGYIFDALLSQADQALYQSKREGRNRVSLYAHTPAS
jgi:diguanylate cyclase